MMKQIKIIIFIIYIITTLKNFSYGTTGEEEIFTIDNIQVFSDFGTVAESKKIALDKATREAVFILLNKIAIEKQNGKFNSIIQNDNSYLVKKYIILHERITSHSYYATVRVQFSPDSVKTLLNKHGINFATKLYDNCLIIPFYNVPKNLNIRWLKLMPEQFGLVEPIVMRKDLDDITSFNVSNSMNYTYKDFHYLLKKYNAKEVMLVQVLEEDQNMYVKVKFITPSNTYNKNFIFEKNIDEEEEEVHRRIINEVLHHLDLWWKGAKGVWN